MTTKQGRSNADVIDSARLGFEVLVARIRELEEETATLRQELEKAAIRHKDPAMVIVCRDRRKKP